MVSGARKTGVSLKKSLSDFMTNFHPTSSASCGALYFMTNFHPALLALWQTPDSAVTVSGSEHKGGQRVHRQALPHVRTSTPKFLSSHIRGYCKVLESFLKGIARFIANSPTALFCPSNRLAIPLTVAGLLELGLGVEVGQVMSAWILRKLLSNNVRSASIEVELTPQEPSKIDNVQSETEAPSVTDNATAQFAAGIWDMITDLTIPKSTRDAPGNFFAKFHLTAG
ncbi:hypothetical protein B0H13DRAFT_1883473 [Mycena leptocephala]|nr:hypothetical protein B0H13DRAFT_1883473 [Mycena leptocephala]